MILQVDTEILTAEEIDLLRSLIGEGGTLVDIKKKQEKTKAKPCKQELVPYYLRVHTTCKTCEAEYTQFFRMELADDNSGLFAMPYTGEMLHFFPFKFESRVIRSCSGCRTNLLNFEKEVVIEKLMKEVTRLYE